MKLEEIRNLIDAATTKFDAQKLTNNEAWEWAVACRTLMPKLLAVAEAAREIHYGSGGMRVCFCSICKALAALESDQ